MSRTSTSRERSNLLRHVSVCSPEQSADLDLDEVIAYLSGLFPSLSFKVTPSPFRAAGKKKTQALSKLLAAARVKDQTSEVQSCAPMPAEVDYELRTIRNDAKIGGIVYDGRSFEDALVSVLGHDLSARNAAVVVTDRLISTYSRDDLRHHLRTVMFGFPSIISLPGIVEAPAKPREYYLLRQQLGIESSSDLRLEQLRSILRGRFLDYGDPETIEVVKGLALQSLMFHLTLDPFCKEKGCRLFNAHWQEDLIRSQITKGGLCRRHAAQLRRLSDRPVPIW